MGILNGIFGYKKTKRDFVLDEFKTQIELHGLKIDSIDETELISIQKGEVTLKISLDNIRKDYSIDKDKTIIADFAKTIAEFNTEESYSWNDIKDNIFVSLYPTDYEINGFVFENITDQLNKIYVIQESNKFSWISEDDIQKWNVSKNDLEIQALKNGNLIANNSKLEIELIEGRKLGYIETEDSNLKASILLSESFQSIIKSELGFPFNFVIPNRDFCYIFSKSDFEFFSKRIGKTIIEEHKNSSYPFSTEILEISQSGIEIKGSFPKE
ncbi:hypothetical protein F7018_06875 [Tenacibaculum aiptasiae]|uniref:DUF1444 family protein n=1 Tax=Tenacibaculum aiptasiae TaxID=426481 RepID=A0A7J5AMM9_9FLAO|nr:hypothetical protein [Tenacibaculum aiptasiae]KAB1158823.1 hypothetical protein F7018_06875 [Tenacibaculum aiptasiae]